MKLKYPAEAFALGIILFSAGMKEAFAAGILMILTAVFAEFLKDLLENRVPEWSLRLCVYIASASVCSSAFLTGFAALGIQLESGVWLLTFAEGLLCAHQVLRSIGEDKEEASSYGDLLWESAICWGFWIVLAIVREFAGSGQIFGNTLRSIGEDKEEASSYGDLLWESAICWGFWIVLAIVREFAGSGQIFGNTIWKAGFQSKAFLDVYFAFIAAGLVLAFTNGVLKKECRRENSFLAVIPAMLVFKPFTTSLLPEALEVLWCMAVPVLLFFSVKQTLKFSGVSRSYRGLPTDMLAAGLIYMVLSIY